MVARLILVSALAIWLAGSSIRGLERENDSVTLNSGAFEYAKSLIKEGRVVVDNHGSWQYHQVSAQDENDFIRQHGFDEYAKWHLGIDENRAVDTKARYKFPYGDFQSIHRCALLAAKQRAREYHHLAVESAAAQLLEMINLPKENSKQND